MKAINFNFPAMRMAEGETYNFTFVSGETSTEYTITRAGTVAKVSNGRAAASVDIFRDSLPVWAVIEIALKAPGVVTSGAVYKMDICTANNDHYTTTCDHTGTAGYHTTPAINKPAAAVPYMLGVELELITRTRDAYQTLNAIHSNVFHREQDGSLSGGAGGQEWITCPLIPSDACDPQFWAPYMDKLTQYATSRTNSCTGLHVHISREAFTIGGADFLETLSKVIYFHEFIVPEGIKSAIYGRDRARWAEPWAHRENGEKIVELAKKAPGILRDGNIIEMIKEDADHVSEHYERINTSKRATIEFRQGKGHINSDHIARICQFVDTLVKFCRETPHYKLTLDRYAASLPTSRKYDNLRRALEGIED